jgi:integrase
VEAVLQQAVTTDIPTERLIDQIRAIRGESAPGVPWGRVWDMFLQEQRRRVAERTQSNRRIALERLVKWVENNTASSTINAFTRIHAAMYYEHLLKSGLAHKTANNIKGDLSSIWSTILVRADLAENVWTVVRSVENQSRHGRAFTSGEVEDILKQARDEGAQWEEACLIALYTGLRQGDIYGLRPEHVQGDMFVLPPSKTRRSSGVVVAVPIHREITGRIRELADAGGDWLLPEFRESLDRDRKRFSKILRRAKIRADGAHLTFHCFRHSFRTRLTAAGVDEAVIRRLAGWTTDVAEIYNHDVTSLRRAIDVLL